MPVTADLTQINNSFAQVGYNGGRGFDLRALARNANPIGAMRAAAQLPLDAQYVIDNEVVATSLEPLNLIDSLITNQRLVRPLPNWYSVMQLGWPRRGKSGVAQVGMEPGTEFEDSAVDREYEFVPVYCIWEGFKIPGRELAESQRVGLPLNVDAVAEGTRRVREKMEDTVIYGGAQFKGLSAPGILSAPSANLVTTLHDWDNGSTTPAQIYADVTTLLRAALHVDHHYGPKALILGTSYNDVLDQDYYPTYGGMSLRQRLLQIDELSEIVVSHRFPANTVAMYEQNRQVLSVIEGQQPTAITIPSLNPFAGITGYVLACVIPWLRDDYYGQSGVVIGTPS